MLNVVCWWRIGAIHTIDTGVGVGGKTWHCDVRAIVFPNTDGKLTEQWLSLEANTHIYIT